MFTGTDAFQASLANITGLVGTGGLGSAAAAISNYQSMFDKVSESQSIFDRISDYESTMAKFAGLGLGGLSGSLLGTDRLAWAGNFVVEAGTSGLLVPSPDRLVLPREAAAEVEARDFLRMLRLALLMVQSRGRAGGQALLRLTTSTPTKAAGLSLAVATVYVLMQHLPNFDEVVGDLANAIEVVLFPFGAWVIAKKANDK
jgi:hypothetical protein